MFRSQIDKMHKSNITAGDMTVHGMSLLDFWGKLLFAPFCLLGAANASPACVFVPEMAQTN